MNIPGDFDWKKYTELNGDLNILNQYQAIQHYLQYGIKENRIYNTNNMPIDFDWKKYTELNVDLTNLKRYQAIQHYLKYGIKENRIYHTNNIPIDFDWKNYLELNTDLNFINEKECIIHYLKYGIKENRKYKLIENNTINTINNINIFNDKILIVNAIFGLGNRLRAIASAYSICKSKNMQLIIIWVPDCHCDCNIEDLFININEYAVTINKNMNIDYLNKFKCYNYLETEENGKKNEYIDVDVYSKIYVKSNCILNSLYSHNYFLDFFKQIKYNEKINNLINSICCDNYIGMHIRMEGGKDNQTLDADKGTNWTKEEEELMYKYRSMSHIDNFIEQINYELNKNPNAIFYISSDLKINYDKLLIIYGENKIKYIKRDLYDRTREQINYAIADIILLSKCKKFYGSFWSSFTEMVTYFQEEYTRKTNILSNNFINNKNDKISIVYGCKNRERNLIQSINSIINYDIIDDIVIVDFNTNVNLRDFLKQKIDNKIFDEKITIIEVTNTTPWILSYCYNIGLLFVKNRKIIKSDSDYIFSKDCIDYLYNCDLTNCFYSFDWSTAKTENQRHLNGFFYFDKEYLNKYGYFNQNIIFYGWDDDDLKNTWIKNKIEYKKLLFEDDSYLYHVKCNDEIRVKDTTSDNFIHLGINFFGFDLRNIVNLSPLIQYNRIFTTVFNTENTTEKDVLDIFNIQESFNKYCKIQVNFKKIKKYNNNLNFLHKNISTICNIDVFERMCVDTNYNFWCENFFSNPNFFAYIVNKFNITEIKHTILLFYIFYFNVKDNKDNNDNINLVITLYNESSIDRCLELLTCLKLNTENKYISNIHILYENPDINSFLFEIIKELSNSEMYNFKSKIIITPIQEKATHNFILEYCKNIIGNIVILNSDIVYNK